MFFQFYFIFFIYFGSPFEFVFLFYFHKLRKTEGKCIFLINNGTQKTKPPSIPLDNKNKRDRNLILSLNIILVKNRNEKIWSGKPKKNIIKQIYWYKRFYPDVGGDFIMFWYRYRYYFIIWFGLRWFCLCFLYYCPEAHRCLELNLSFIKCCSAFSHLICLARFPWHSKNSTTTTEKSYPSNTHPRN